VLAEPPSLPAPVPVKEESPPVPALAPGLVEVELPSGVRLRISGEVETVALRRILLALR